MLKRTLTIVLFVLFLANVAMAQMVVPWNEAHKYYGQHVTVEGTIVSTYNSGKACFLNFHQDYKKYFTAVIFKSDFGKFPTSPEDYYYSKKVHVTGNIKEYKGKPEIILKEPSQIQILSGQITPKKKEIISWKDAQNYYGQIATVEGEVVNTYNSGKACFLNFHKNWRQYFTVVIFSSDFHNFPSAPEVYYKNKKVEVTGLIKEYKGKPEIIVKSPSQIKISGN